MSHFYKHLIFTLICMLNVSLVSAEEYTLKEDTEDRAFQTNITINVKGKLSTPQQNETKVSMPIELRAESRFAERRLPSAGRDARAIRAIRLMERAIADIKVDQETVRSNLPASVKRIILEGRQEGLFIYSPDVYLSRNHLELITTPGDPLCFQPFLKEDAVKIGDEWQVPLWASTMFCTHEASVKAELKCKLESVERDLATVKFSGTSKGAITGANSEVTVTGKLVFNTKTKAIEEIEAEQHEVRAIGTVNPGMDVTATIKISRVAISVPEKLDNKSLEGIPLDPPDKVKPLVYQSADWKVEFFHDRNWHIFQELPNVVVLRMVEQGSLIAQCNLSLVQRNKEGDPTPLLKYQDDIKKSLGERFGDFVEAKELDSQKGVHIYRVVVKGKANNLDMQWNYYLYTNPDGRQISYAFAMEEKLAEKLKDRDIGMVMSVHFLPE